LTLQLAKDIISDLREILKQVRSTENKLRHEQEELENTIERALGKNRSWKLFYSYTDLFKIIY
jgi:hypothetical protein